MLGICEELHLLFSISSCEQFGSFQSRPGKAIAFEMIVLLSCFLVSLVLKTYVQWSCSEEGGMQVTVSLIFCMYFPFGFILGY